MFVKSLIFTLLINAAVGAPFFTILNDAFTSGMSTVNDGFQQFTKPVTSAVTDIPTMLGQGASSVGSGFKTISSNSQTAANTALNATAGLVGSGIKMNSNILANKLRLLGQAVKTVDQINKNILNGTITIGSAISGAAGNEITSFGKMSATGLGVATGGLDALTTLANNNNKLVVGAVDKVGEGINSGIQGTTNNIASIIENTSSQGTKMFDQVSTMAQNSTKNTLTEINKAIDSATTNSETLTKNGVNQVLTTLNTGSEAVNSAIPQASTSMKNAAAAAEDSSNKSVQVLNNVVDEAGKSVTGGTSESTSA